MAVPTDWLARSRGAVDSAERRRGVEDLAEAAEDPGCEGCLPWEVEVDWFVLVVCPLVRLATCASLQMMAIARLVVGEGNRTYRAVAGWCHTSLQLLAS